MIERDIVFLIYLNRSGSTFLANQLSGHPELAVAPEGHRPLRRLLGHIGPRIPLTARLKQLEYECGHDEKFGSWQIDPGKLRVRLAGVTNEIDALYAVCDAYADSVRPKATSVLLKGYYFQELIVRHGFDRLARGRGIHALVLLRDPRAMFASQKHSLSTQSGMPMQNNPVAAAIRWRGMIRKAIRLSEDSRMKLIRYEDLVTDNAATLGNTAASLGLDPAPLMAGHQSSKSLDAMIPEQQRLLHQNISRPPLTERIDAWQGNLSSIESEAIIMVAGRLMRELGYKIESEERSFKVRPLALLWMAFWAGKMGVRRIGKLFL